MRDYNKSQFSEVLKLVEDKKQSEIQTEILSEEFISLQYFLTRNFYYSVIVDDYPFEISDKSSLLEALFYQTRLITIHDLNWDAIQEGFETLLDDNLVDFEGICLLFKQGIQLKSNMQSEFMTLTEIIQMVNRQNVKKKITIIMT